MGSLAGQSTIAHPVNKIQRERCQHFYCYGEKTTDLLDLFQNKNVVVSLGRCWVHAPLHHLFETPETYYNTSSFKRGSRGAGHSGVLKARVWDEGAVGTGTATSTDLIGVAFYFCCCWFKDLPKLPRHPASASTIAYSRGVRHHAWQAFYISTEVLYQIDLLALKKSFCLYNFKDTSASGIKAHRTSVKVRKVSTEN